jgi:hypothetical protein
MEERMALMRDDPAVDLTVDGNAVGGLLGMVFATDVTAAMGRCASCQTSSLVGTMRVYMRGPGVVVRCPACAEVVMRVAETPSGMAVDVRGVAMLRVPPAR